MLRTHEANKSILFAQIWDPYELPPDKFAQLKDALFVHVYKALSTDLLHAAPKLAQIKGTLFAHVYAA